MDNRHENNRIQVILGLIVVIFGATIIALVVLNGI